MNFVDSIRGNIRRVVNEQVDSELLSLGFQYEYGEENELFLVGHIKIQNDCVKVVIINNHQLYITVWDYDEYHYGERHKYEFVENTSLLGLVQNAIQKENR